MKNFTLSQAAAHFAGLAHTLDVELVRAAGKWARSVRDTAKAEIGSYQSATGEFEKWEDLTEQTEEQKAHAGYPLDAPLLRDGTLRDSITAEVMRLGALDGVHAIVGSTDDRMLFHEFGTITIPPRPVLGPAAIHRMGDLVKFVDVALRKTFA